MRAIFNYFVTKLYILVKCFRWDGEVLLFKRQPHKMVKHTQTIRQLSPRNFLSVFYYFVGLALNGLN